jgi:pantoate--beta-alanine ligase
MVTDRAALRQLLDAVRAAGQSIGLVPTMGALHEGHLSLVRRSVSECDTTVVTIFVNPTQFGPTEDLARYPRTLSADLTLLADACADVVFVPDNAAMYPTGFSTYVDPPAVSAPLEGICRPGHFRGVATIVLKLLNLVAPTVAYFGEKDYQQARVIEDMVRDLDLPMTVEVCPIIREPDGLAMSSRNRYMSQDERARALSLSRALRRACELFQQGERSGPRLCEAMRQQLHQGTVTDIEYATIVDPQTLQPPEMVDADCRALIAARVGHTRLIDNCRVGEACH